MYFSLYIFLPHPNQTDALEKCAKITVFTPILHFEPFVLSIHPAHPNILNHSKLMDLLCHSSTQIS